MGWNAERHGRKFLRSAGRFIDRQRTSGSATLVFWGEWEGPSRVVERWDPDGRQPRFLHEPFWASPPRPVNNTDPWVFGEAFRFSNCKQLTADGRPSALQDLTPGSLVLFGSQIERRFVLDTVFVVADATPYTPATATHLRADDAFNACTLQPLALWDNPRFHFPDAELTLFRGATPDTPLAGMFSFVPAQRDDGPQTRFARPSIDLPGFLNPKSSQSPSGARRRRSIGEVQGAWESVKDQVFQTGCVLGVDFPSPPAGELAGTHPTGGRAC